MPELLFHGGAGEVTGSMHMLRFGGRWIALDCGLFQGHRADAEAKNRTWPVPPHEIAAVILSHAHIDHSGRLPKLVKDGFTGTIYCTHATRDLSAVMLPDSAHIQEEDIPYVNKKRARRNLPPVDPLYGYHDALAAVNAMQSVSFDRWFPVVEGVTARFHEAGHMLGSAGVELAFGPAGGATGTLYFTGDVGRPGAPILRDPAPFPACDALLCESTYGGRDGEDPGQAGERFVEAVRRTYTRGGKLIVPAFSVGRTQTLVYYLHQQMVAGGLPRYPIFVDSPLAVNATEVFKMHPECYDAEARAFHKVTGDILGHSAVTYIRDVEESKALNQRRNPCTIISASGMCEAGRIRHHLKNHVGDARNTILVPGFQAEGTLGRRLVDGARQITLFHEVYPVRAEVMQIDGFSGHADQADLLRLLRPLASRVREAFLVHGEPDQSQALQAQMVSMGPWRVRCATRGMQATL